MIDLQLKKARLDQIDNTNSAIPNGDGRVIDRNELLRHIKEQIAEKPDNGK